MLRGKRICLRPLEAGDAGQLLAWGQDPYYQQTAGFAHYRDLEEARQGVLAYQQRPASYMICLKSGQAIGLLELYPRDAQSRELGFLLDKKFQGQGYMTESIRCLLAEVFKNPEIKEVWAGCKSGNLRPQQLLKKLGFKEMYELDYRQIPPFLDFSAKYYLLKSGE
ncbi:ribosomal-protein-alanine N-acetyltransferase [Lactobacillus nasalidis]|uniref:Ribosomal-protein-alanine N-acetyltransferase n=1 Tax=Lactobacillus nasalidis TaxID=2797258 RepID=A0ABQ3W2F9_9LACO|nr:GNAT family N-acetyltransferase [Lactobacillus nasalidis]GHV96904.1 ribosomal-protein-alanine N-acetyltransferase [Lactobacillus nasalidis]GHV99996.1 ribosomal-protein-alanine N-acetyltransferase [Lactobacillus nasalidis]GHW00466.1 ribosomal-protein-alanine N-acetyltransferase [Lactobacillus nasalidis]